MSIKRDVPEKCPLCGQKDAELRGNQVAWGMHRCPHAPQGPSTPPRFSSVNDVNFVRCTTMSDAQEVEEQEDEKLLAEIRVIDPFAVRLPMGIKALVSRLRAKDAATIAQLKESFDAIKNILHCTQHELTASQEQVKMLREVLPVVREELRACQATIHLSGDFDPAYVIGAQAAMKRADAVLAATAPKGETDAGKNNQR